MFLEPKIFVEFTNVAMNLEQNSHFIPPSTATYQHFLFYTEQNIELVKIQMRYRSEDMPISTTYPGSDSPRSYQSHRIYSLYFESNNLQVLSQVMTAPLIFQN